MNKWILAAWARALSSAGVFGAWTLTSFLCHECSKMFLTVSESMFLSRNHPNASETLTYYRFFSAALVTAVQCCSCALLTRMDTTLSQSRLTPVLITSHVLATLVTNYSMVFMEAASTLAIKLMEPITMAVAHHVVFQTKTPIQTVVSVPLIIYGALIFTGVKTNRMSDAAGTGLAFASNIILAARNIAMKKLQQGSTTQTLVALNPLPRIAITVFLQGLFVVVIYVLDVHGFTPKNSSVLAAFVLMSGVFHVAYSYISTSIVLKVMNVVSHSIANISKRLLVVLLLYALGTRTASAGNFLGLGIAVAGLLVYTYGKISADQQTGRNVQAETPNSEPFRGKLYAAVGCMALVIVAVICSTGWISKAVVSTPATDNIASNNLGENHSWREYRMPSVDFSHILNKQTDPAMKEFLKRRLIDTPEETDKRAKLLTSNKQVIEESQRILVNLLQDLLGKAKHVMLIEIATYENKGDPAITAGEVMLLRMLNVSIVFYCDTYTCLKNKHLREALHVNSQYPKDELVLLLQGGGNLVGYQYMDKVREKYISIFPNRSIIMFSQSIWLRPNNTKQLEYPRSVYSNRSNLVMFLRDRQSLEIARANFQGVRLILAPDLAFCIGMVPRQFPPLYDIVWLKRGDTESSKYALPSFPPNISVDVKDWRNSWKSNKGHTAMDNSFLVATEGFQFLQRGRVVVTDRLHGHILSTLMNIPHVLIDNPPFFKLSSFDKSWTASLRNTILVTNGSLALDAAMELLRTYDKSLPLVGPRDMYVGVNGNVRKPKV